MYSVKLNKEAYEKLKDIQARTWQVKKTKLTLTKAAETCIIESKIEFLDEKNN